MTPDGKQNVVIITEAIINHIDDEDFMSSKLEGNNEAKNTECRKIQ